MKHIKSVNIKRASILFISGGLLYFIFLSGISYAENSGKMQMGNMREMMQRMMGNQLPPGLDPTLLPEPQSNGAGLLQKYCAQCHNLPGPGMHTSNEWSGVIDRMNMRMKMMSKHSMMGKIEAATEQELKSITVYLKRHAQKPINKKKYPTLSSTDGQAFSRVCAQCHALPDPKQHTAKDWPSVVIRMQKNMTVMGKPVPNEQKLKKIIEFLQQHARASR